MADQHQHREEFERRLLALVRDYMDDVDEMNPDGYEIGDFMVIYEVFERIPESKPLEPWSGGVRAGFDSPYIAFSSTTGMYWQDEAWLREALYRVQTRREDRRAEANAQDEPEPSDEDDT